MRTKAYLVFPAPFSIFVCHIYHQTTPCKCWGPAQTLWHVSILADKLLWAAARAPRTVKTVRYSVRPGG